MKKLSLYILGIVAAGLLLGGLASTVNRSTEQDTSLGARIPTVVALYTDSLASRISNSATSFTLTRGTDKQSRSLSGYYGFVIDEGTSVEEFFTASCSGTVCTVVARGIDVQDGETEVSALKYEHRRGAVVKITNFPQLALLSRILNGQESASSTFMIGDGSTTTTLFKTIFNDNGTANKPYVRYNEATGKWQFSDDGLNTVNFSTGTASGLSASTTLAINITDSQIGVNVSSTASGNGGYIGIGQQTDGTYRMYFDSPLFLSTQQMFSDIRGTSTGITLDFAPTSIADATNRGYVDNSIVFGTATGTAGMAITAGKAVYISSTSSLFHTNTSVVSSTIQFVGVAQNTTSTGGVVTYSRPGGTNCNQSGLSPGYNYYLNGNDGEIATTADTTVASARVGLALNSACVSVSHPKYISTGFYTTTTGIGTIFVNTGFSPAYVTVRASMTGNSNCDNLLSFGDSNNTVTYNNGGTNGNAYETDRAIKLRNSTPATCIEGTISLAQNGFNIVLTTLEGVATAGIGWTAFSE